MERPPHLAPLELLREEEGLLAGGLLVQVGQGVPVLEGLGPLQGLLQEGEGGGGPGPQKALRLKQVHAPL